MLHKHQEQHRHHTTFYATNSNRAVTPWFLISSTNVFCLQQHSNLPSMSSLLPNFFPPLCRFASSLYVCVTILQLARWDNSSTARYSELSGRVMDHRAPIKCCIISGRDHEPLSGLTAPALSSPILHNHQLPLDTLLWIHLKSRISDLFERQVNTPLFTVADK